MKTRQVSEFKETEFGKVPVDWEIILINDSCEKIIDYRGKTPKKTSSGIILVTAKMIKDGRINFSKSEFIDAKDYDIWMTRGIPKSGDIVITTEGPLGEVAQLDDKKIALAQRVITLRGEKDLLTNNYLRYVLQSRYVQEQLFSRSTGTTIGGIKQSELRQILLPIPSIKIQNTISKNLIELDEKIDNLQNQNHILEQMAQAIFKSWFVDFDGVTEWDDSELGKIPKGWSVNILDSIANNVRNTIKSKDITPDIFYIGLEHMPRDNVGLDTWENSNKLKSNKFKFETNQILFGKLRPYFKKVGISPINGICSTDILVLNSKDTSWLEFLLFTVSSYDFIEYASQSTTGTKMPRTDWDYMKKYKIIFPPLTKVLKFHVIIKKLIEMMRKNIFEIKTLTKTRDILLPKLMSGEIRV